MKNVLPAFFEPHGFLRTCVLFAALLVLSGCAAKLPRGMVRDLEILPQDLTAYLDPTKTHDGLIPDTLGLPLSQQFLQRFFGPWSRTRPSLDPEEFAGYLSRAANRTVYGENTLPRPASWAERLAESADMNSLFTLNKHAITVRHTALRLLPTNEAMFNDFSKPGEGFPFDMAQNSAVWAGTPLFVARLSRDQDWALVETHYASGWMPVTDMAFVDDAFISRYTTGQYAAVVRDNTPVTLDQGSFLLRARIGMLLPLDAGPSDMPAGSERRVLVPVRTTEGNAATVPALLRAGSSALFPLDMSAWNVAALGNQMLGETYGWGGLFQKRDCSATMQDLFTPFGIALPRNSKAQAQAGPFIPLDHFDARAKEDAILQQGVPFATLIYKPGHIMLYVGQRNGHPVILHNLWGLRGSDLDGPTPGRIVIGRTVITSLTPGAERPDLVKPGGLLLEGVTGMTLLPKN
ncbi:MAG: SH3 domain-containing protein [Desulfovibrio sp.]